MPHDEAPAGLLRALAIAADRAAARRVHACKALPPCPHRSPQAESIPFGDDRIPEKTLIEIAQRMSTEGIDVRAAAEEYDLATELLQLELARLLGRHRQEMLRRSAWRRPMS